MSKMIKLTDEVGSLLEEWAAKDSVSLAGEVRLLLDYRKRADGVTALEIKIDKIQSMLEDTLVDRIDAHKTRDPINEKVYIEWDIVQELFYEFLDEKSTEWRPGVYNEVSNLDDELNCYTQDGYLCVDDYYGKTHQLVQVTPRVDQFLAEKIEGRIKNVA